MNRTRLYKQLKADSHLISFISCEVSVICKDKRVGGSAPAAVMRRYSYFTRYRDTNRTPLVIYKISHGYGMLLSLLPFVLPGVVLMNHAYSLT